MGLRRLVLCSSVGAFHGVQASCRGSAVGWRKAGPSRGGRGVWCTACGSCSGWVSALGQPRMVSRQGSRPCRCPFGRRSVDNAPRRSWEHLPAREGHEHSRWHWRQTSPPSGSGDASHPGYPHRLCRTYHRRYKRGVSVVCCCSVRLWLGVSRQARRLQRQPHGARDNKLFAESGER